MPYSYASVLDAVRSNPSLECVLPIPCCPNYNVGWCAPLTDPKECNEGNAQKCEQRLIVRTETGGIYHLYFRFKVSPNAHEGFINEGDNRLNFLIQNNFIAKKRLCTVQAV
jgi:hypothetical protein